MLGAPMLNALFGRIDRSYFDSQKLRVLVKIAPSPAVHFVRENVGTSGNKRVDYDVLKGQRDDGRMNGKQSSFAV